MSEAPMTAETGDLIHRIVEGATALVDAVTFDDSGAYGRGGNGGLLSRDTIKCSDELHQLILRWIQQETRP